MYCNSTVHTVPNSHRRTGNVSCVIVHKKSMMAAASEYSSVVLSLENTIYPEEKLRDTPSQLDGLSKAMETNLRIVGCEYIQASGILLKLPQVS